MRVYHDWEFLEDGTTIDPISVGLAAEDGRSYYAAFNDMPLDRIMQHGWLRENVVPHLPVIQMGDSAVLKGYHADVKPRSQIAAEVQRFLLDTPNLELWGWYSAHDHVALAQLWGPMVSLPEGIPMWTNDLRQTAHELGVQEDRLPKQLSSHAHNALNDAKHMLEIAAELERIKWNHLPS